MKLSSPFHRFFGILIIVSLMMMQCIVAAPPSAPARSIGSIDAQSASPLSVVSPSFRSEAKYESLHQRILQPGIDAVADEQHSIPRHPHRHDPSGNDDAQQYLLTVHLTSSYCSSDL